MCSCFLPFWAHCLILFPPVDLQETLKYYSFIAFVDRCRTKVVTSRSVTNIVGVVVLATNCVCAFDVTTSYNSVDRAAWLGKVTSQRHA
jgi:hypothetical protein